jgi:toll-interacting protein
MDPYCRLRVGNTVFETPTDASGGKSPKWNRTVHCYLPNGVDTIFLEIFDERAFSTDERIAWAHITIPDAVFFQETIDDWYQLSGKEGEGKEGMANLVLSFAPVDAPPINYVPITQVFMPAVPAAAAQPPIQGDYPTPPVPGQEASPPPPLYTEEDAKELAEMFPNMEAEVIRSVLDEKRGNKDAAVNALLSIGSD